MAAPLVSAIGLAGAIVSTGVLAAAYAALVALPRQAGGRHRAPRLPRRVETPARLEAIRVAKAIQFAEAAAV